MFNSSLFTEGSGLNLSSILNGIDRGLSVVNKALPLYEEAKPIVENIKSTFKTFTGKTNSKEAKKEVVKTNEVKNTTFSTNTPTFFQ